jgi:hypothetical protein
MRHSNHAGRGSRLPIAAIGLLALIVAACGPSTSTTPPPSAGPTPVVTPDPHLTAPVTADDMFRILIAAKVPMQCPNANLGNGNPKIVKQINCTVSGWPLRIIQYTTTAALTGALDWAAGSAPGGDEAPYNWAGLNILIQLGPISARAPSTPEAARQAIATSIFAVLDPLLWPIAQHSVVAVPGRTPTPIATPTPTPTTRATTKPAPKPTPKPTKQS